MTTTMSSADSIDLQLQTQNQAILAQINHRLFSGFGAAIGAGEYCVVRSTPTGVLSVLSAQNGEDGQATVFGPASFERCMKHVNAAMVAKIAEDGDPDTKQTLKKKP